MKKTFLFLAIALIFSQCQVPPITNNPNPNPYSLEGVCDSISTSKYLYSGSSEFRLNGSCKVDYNSVVIDSSDNDSVFVYANINCKIDMAANKSQWLMNPNGLALDTPTHVCLAGGQCYFADNNHTHTKCMTFPGNSVMKLKWSNISGLLESDNPAYALIVKMPKILPGGHTHPALLPNYNLYSYVDNNMANKDWWVITINVKTQRYNGGMYWNYI